VSTGNQNLDLLIKLLGQTTNDNDNTALMAIRAANRQVEKFKTTWEDLLRGRVTIVADPFTNMVAPPVRRTQAPPATVPRPAPPPPPRPQAPRNPNPFNQAPPQQPAQPTYPASNATGRPNRFRTRCHKCGRQLDAQQGLLVDQSPITGNWRVECSQIVGGCLASYQRPKGAAKKSTDNLTDLL